MVNITEYLGEIKIKFYAIISIARRILIENWKNRGINGKYYGIFGRDKKELEDNNYGCIKFHIN